MDILSAYDLPTAARFAWYVERRFVQNPHLPAQLVAHLNRLLARLTELLPGVTESTIRTTLQQAPTVVDAITAIEALQGGGSPTNSLLLADAVSYLLLAGGVDRLNLGASS